MTEERRRIIEELTRALSQEPGLRLALLFGSAARDALRKDSDVDVAIVPEYDLLLKEELQLEARLSRAIGREVDLVRLDKPNVLLRWEVAKNYVTLLAKPPSARARFVAAAALDHADMQPLLDEASRRLARRLANRPADRACEPGAGEPGA